MDPQQEHANEPRLEVLDDEEETLNDKPDDAHETNSSGAATASSTSVASPLTANHPDEKEIPEQNDNEKAAVEAALSSDASSVAMAAEEEDDLLSERNGGQEDDNVNIQENEDAATAERYHDKDEEEDQQSSSSSSNDDSEQEDKSNPPPMTVVPRRTSPDLAPREPMAMLDLEDAKIQYRASSSRRRVTTTTGTNTSTTTSTTQQQQQPGAIAIAPTSLSDEEEEQQHDNSKNNNDESSAPDLPRPPRLGRAQSVTESLRRNKEEYSGGSRSLAMSMTLTTSSLRQLQQEARRHSFAGEELSEEIVFERDDDENDPNDNSNNNAEADEDDSDSSHEDEENEDNDHMAEISAALSATRESLHARLRAASITAAEEQPNDIANDNDSSKPATPASSSAFMVQAMLVPDLEEAIVIEDLNQYAHDQSQQNLNYIPVHGSNNNNNKQRQRLQYTNTCLIGVAVLILAAALAIGLGIGLSDNGEGGGAASLSAATTTTKTTGDDNPTNSPMAPSSAPSQTQSLAPSVAPSLAPSFDPVLYYRNGFELVLPNVAQGNRRMTRIGGDESAKFQQIRTPIGSSNSLSIWQFLNHPDILLSKDDSQCVRYGDLVYVKNFGQRRRHVRGRGGGPVNLRQVTLAADCIVMSINFCGWVVTSKAALQDFAFLAADPRLGECVQFGHDIYITHPHSAFLVGGIGDEVDQVMSPSQSNLTEIADRGLWTIQRVAIPPTPAPNTPSPTTQRPTTSPTPAPTREPSKSPIPTGAPSFTMQPSVSGAPSVIPSNLFYQQELILDLQNIDGGQRRLTRDGIDSDNGVQAVHTPLGTHGILSRWQFLSHKDISLSMNTSECVRYGEEVWIKSVGALWHLRGRGGGPGPPNFRSGVQLRNAFQSGGAFGWNLYSLEALQDNVFVQDPRSGECVGFQDIVYIGIAGVGFLVGGLGASTEDVKSPDTNASLAIQAQWAFQSP